jgi:NADPH-dependent ferric siderophore reductase
MFSMPNTDGVEPLPAPRVHLCEVVRTRQLTPRVQQVTVGGCGLAGFPVADADAFAYLLLPPAGRDEMSIGLDFEWSHVRSMPREERPRGAYYSVRHHRPDALEIDLEIVCHDDGVAAGWAAAATPGDKAALWGPRVLFDPPEDTTWTLLLADDTGVPAMLSILERLPVDQRVAAVAEVADPGEVRHVEPGPCVDLRWVCRSRDERAVDVVRSLRLPASAGYAWGGGEHGWIQELDELVADVHGVDAERRSLTSYWRRNQPTGLR